MPQIRLPSGVVIWDLGPVLNRLFDDIYARRTFSLAALKTAAWAYFDTHPNPDLFAFNFGPLGLPHADARVAGLKFWEVVLALMEDWEEAHPGHRLHKGGAYYFAAIRDIVMGDLDRGFLYMHKAAAEDLRTYGPGRTPSVAFTTLDPRKQDQAFKRQVEIYSAYLQRRLASYRRHRAGTLTLPELRRRFGRHPQLREPLFALAYSVARLDQVTGPGTERITGSELARMVLARQALDLALIVEELLHDTYASQLRLKNPRLSPTFVPLAREYAVSQGYLIEPALSRLSSSLARSFDSTMAKLLSNLMTFSTPTVGALTTRDFDLAVVAGLRNHAAHGVSRSTLIADRFEELVRRTFYVLFAVIEDCYL